MKFAVSILSSVLALSTYGQQLGAVQRVYSATITNLAWSVDEVFVRERTGELVDPTGTIAKYADIEYLKAVNDGMHEVLEAGSNAFVQAKANFYTALSNNPPVEATHIKMISAPHTNTDPASRCPYGLLVEEKGRNLKWYLSAPFNLKPNIVRRLRRLADDGTHWVTNFETVAWVDYHEDRTNDTPYAVGDYPRTIRMEDAIAPSGIETIIRDSHLHFGHPISGIEWGGMNMSVVDSNGAVWSTLTGCYTARVDNVTYEFILKNGAFKEISEVE